jgi:hypothetical protein
MIFSDVVIMNDINTMSMSAREEKNLVMQSRL